MMNSNNKKANIFRVIAISVATAICAVSICVPTKINPSISVAVAADETVERYEVGDYVEMSSKSEFWNIRKSHEFGDNIYETKLLPNQQFLITEAFADDWFKVQIEGWDETETYIQISSENAEWFELKAKVGEAVSTSFSTTSTTTSTATTTSETTTTTAVQSTTTAELATTISVVNEEPAVFSEIKSGDSCVPFGELTLYVAPREDASTIQTYEMFMVKKVISEDWLEVWVPKSHKPYYIKDNNFYVDGSKSGSFEEGAEITFLGSAYGYFSVKESTFEDADEIARMEAGDCVVIVDKFYDDWYFVESDKVAGFVKVDYRYFSLTSTISPIEPIATSISTTFTTSSTTTNTSNMTTTTTTTAKPISTTSTTTTSKVDANISEFTIQFIGLEWNIRKSADITSDIIGTFTSGDIKSATKKVGDWYLLSDGGWIRVNSEDSIYFVINKKYEISFEEARCGDVLVFVGEEWNIREDSTTNSNVVDFLEPYDAITILGFNGKWILTSKGWIGITDELNFKFYRNL